jgi:hypothetical protein
MKKRTTGYFAVTQWDPGFETQDQATDAGREHVAQNQEQDVSIIYVQLINTLTSERPTVKDNNPFQLTTQGTIENEDPRVPPPPKEVPVEDVRKMLTQAAALVSKTQLELKACRNRMEQQEAELREMREELNRPSGE